MKVALCLSGQPRSVERAFPFIKENIIDPNKPDIFIHSWIDEKIKGHRPVAAGGEVASDTIPENIEQIILDLYKPVDYQFEPQREFDEKNYNDRKAQFIRPRNSLSQRYSVLRAFKLAAQHDQYDVVIRMRFDWAIQVPINVSHYPNDRIIAPNDCPHSGGINDQFAFGNMRHMKTYCELFQEMDTLYNGYKLPFVDEVLLGQHLAMTNTPVHVMHIPYKILRHTGDQSERHTADYVP